MIKVQNLTKKFGPILAINNLSFEVNEGEIVAFMGPNGAGKSTTMRMITGYIPFLQGSITVAGHDIKKDPNIIKALIGYLPENAPAYKNMTPYSFLKFCGAVRGLQGKRLKASLSKVVESCYLNEVLYQPIDTLSKGFSQRVCFAQAIIHDPPILILDEPTDGLDPNQKHITRNLIKNMGKSKTIIISTHLLDEVETCCSRAIIISKGQLRADGTIPELKALSNTANSIIIELKHSSEPELIKSLYSIPSFSKFKIIASSKDKIKLRIYADNIANMNKLTSQVTHQINLIHAEITELKTDPGNLRDVFRKLTVMDNT